MNRLPIIILTLLAALACNPDMFIEPLTVSESKFVMPFTGGTVEVKMGHGDWEIERVALDHIDCNFIEVTDRSDDTHDVQPTHTTPATLRHESNLITFELARPQKDRLVLVVEDVRNYKPMEMEIHLSNPFQSQVIYVHVEPSTGYEFDRIEYGEPVITSPADAYEQAWSVTECNEAAEPVTKEYYVFDIMLMRTVWFPAASVQSKDLPYVAWYDTLMEYVRGPFVVPIPGAVPAGASSDNTSTDVIPFTYDKTIVMTTAPDHKAEVTLMPGDNVVSMYWGYVEYTVPYTMWFKHAGGGRPRCMTGEFTSRAYDGRWRVEVR